MDAEGTTCRFGHKTQQRQQQLIPGSVGVTLSLYALVQPHQYARLASVLSV